MEKRKREKKEKEKKSFLLKISKFAYPLFFTTAERIVRNPSLSDYVITIQQAFPGIDPALLISSIFLLIVVSAISGVFLSIVLVVIGLPPLFWGIPAVGSMLGSLFAFLYPSMAAKERGRKIDGELSYVARFLTVLASSGLPISEMFSRVAEMKDLFPETSKEAALITKNLKEEVMAPLKAISYVAERTPSEKFSEFLRGMVTTLQSGGDLKTYFMTKTEEYEFIAGQRREKEIEGLGTLLEGYIVLAVAFPVFMVIITSSMAMTGTGGLGNTVGFLYLIFLLFLPMAHAMWLYLVAKTFKNL